MQLPRQVGEALTATSLVATLRASTPSFELSPWDWVPADALQASSAPLEGKAAADAFEASSAPISGRVWPDALEPSAVLVVDFENWALRQNVYISCMDFTS